MDIHDGADQGQPEENHGAAVVWLLQKHQPADAQENHSNSELCAHLDEPASVTEDAVHAHRCNQFSVAPAEAVEKHIAPARGSIERVEMLRVGNRNAVDGKDYIIG